MAIKEFITLEGAEDVRKALQDLGAAGEKALSQFRNATGSVNGPLVMLSTGVKDTAQSMRVGAEATGGFRDALHTLHPILYAAGVSMADFRGFAAAAHVGLTGLAVALGGAILVAFAKLSDESTLAKNRLSDLFNNKALGAKAFTDLEEAARRLGTTIANLAPAYESAISLNQKLGTQGPGKWVAPPGQALPEILAKGTTAALPAMIALNEAIRIGGVDAAKAGEDAKRFLDALSQTKTVSGELIRTLSAGAIHQIADAFGQGSLNAQEFASWLDKNPRSVEQLVAALVRAKPQIDQTFDAQKLHTFQDAWDNLKSSFGDLFSGESKIGGFATGAVDLLATILKNLPLELNSIGGDLVSEWTRITGELKPIFDAVMVGIKAGAAVLSDIWTTFTSDATQAWEDIKSSAQSAWNFIKSIFSVNPAKIATDSGGGFARGGFVSGPGSTTSDSILAWLSNREFVINAKAVSHYGSGFFAALNSMKLPRNMFDGFSSGGLVDALSRSLSVPGFAAGGLAIAGHHSVDLRTNFGSVSVTASESAIQQLNRYAVQSRLRSGGRSPGWRT